MLKLKKLIVNWIKKILKNPTITNIAIVAIMTIMVKGTGFYKEIIIADNLGLSKLLDTFYIAILIPGFMSNVFLEGFKSVFIPNYIIEKNTTKNVGAFQSTYIIVTVVVSLLFSFLAYLSTDVYLDLLFPSHDVEFYELIKEQFFYVLPCIFFWGLTSLVNGLLNIYDEFAFSSLSSIFTSLSIIICLIFFKDDLGIIVLAVGTLIGSIISFLFALTIAIKKQIIKIKKPDFVSKNIIEFFKQIPAKLTANLFSGINSIVDQYFGAKLAVGSIAALNYGVRIPMFTIGIVTIALGNVLLPYFSQYSVDNKEYVFEQLRRVIKITFIGSGIISLILIIFSKFIIQLVFEGNAFTTDDTIIVSKVQQMYLLQIPVYIITIIIVRFLEAINKNSFMSFLAILCLALNISLNMLLIDILGVYGLALSTSLVAMFNALTLWIYTERLNKKRVDI